MLWSKDVQNAGNSGKVADVAAQSDGSVVALFQFDSPGSVTWPDSTTTTAYYVLAKYSSDGTFSVCDIAKKAHSIESLSYGYPITSYVL